MKSSFRIARIAGIDIGIHYTWIFIFILITWSLSQGFFPQLYPNFDTTTYWIMGVVSSLLLFASVLAHELAHSLVARARGLPVKSITLFIFGGVSNLQEEPESASVELSMSIVGPLTSLALAGIFWGILQLSPPTVSPAIAVITYLALINLLLGLFNLLPAFPLDGGRVLRSIIWGTSKNLHAATNIAATIGRIFGWALIAFGLFQVFGGNFLGGIWIAFIGWFLSNAAESSRRELTLREHLAGTKVKDIMSLSSPVVQPETTVDEVVRNVFYQGQGRAVVICSNGNPRGILTVSDIKGLPREEWAHTSVEKVMTREPLYTVTPEDDLNHVMKLIAEHDLNQLVVIREGQCAGLISRANLINHLQVSQEIGPKKKES